MTPTKPEEKNKNTENSEEEENNNNEKNSKDKNSRGTFQTEISGEMKKSYLDYAMSVIVARALPAVEDGLKPVQRRILYSMLGLGLKPNTPTKKSARIVGECFVKDTEVLTTKGLIPIQDIKTGDFVYTQNAIHQVEELYEMPEKELLQITLSNGIYVVVTPSQKLKIINEKLEYEWKEAKDLTEKDFIVVKADYPKFKENIKLKLFYNKYLELNENIAYLLGQFISDGWIEKNNRICFGTASRGVVERLKLILEKEFGYVANIEIRNKNYQSNSGQILESSIYFLRINNRALCNFLAITFDLENRHAYNKEVPQQILQSPEGVIYSFLSGLIDGDGYIHKSRKVIQYGSVSEKLINKILLVTQQLGIIGKKYKSKIKLPRLFNNRLIKSNYPALSIEFAGDFARKLALNLNLAEERKRDRLKEILSGQMKKSSFEIIPFLGNLIFSELSDKHVGAGWYKDSDGNKFRLGIRYPVGTKIRYSKNLREIPLRKSQIIEWNIFEKLKRIGSKYHDFIKDIIDNKIYFLQISKIVSKNPEKTYDLQVKNDHEFIANGIVSHNCLGKFHPHGDVAVYDALVRMAQDFSLRYPLIFGQGNFGCFTADTKVALTDGRNLSFVDLMKEHSQGKRNFTFTIDNGEIKIAEIKNPRKTKENAEIMKVVLDNGEEIKCTLNHKFMLRDGNYKEAQYLKPNDSLMPLNLIINPEKINSPMPILIPNKNHKVVKTEFLREFADVYDLTIDNTHNFALASGIFVHNSIDGDPPAAQRYTEARLQPIAMELLQDIEKETVKFIPNYDNSLKEPELLPGKLPVLLLNGASGIAVGMATNIPPHNLTEVCDAIVALIKNPEISIEKLAEIVTAPDFPTGGSVSGDMIGLYKTGKGKLLLRGKTTTETIRGKEAIVITEIPYMVNKSDLVTQIAEMIQNKKIRDVSDLRDESSKGRIRVVLELRKGANPKFVTNTLYKYTRLQDTFSVNFLALVKEQPKILNLKQILHEYVEYRKKIITNRSKFELAKAEERLEIIQGLLIALKSIDDIVVSIKKSKNAAEALESLVSKFKLTKRQAQAVLETRLQQLTSLEQDKLKKENEMLKERIAELKKLLGDINEILKVIVKEVSELKKNYGDNRRTTILQRVAEISEKDLVQKKEVVITITEKGYCKRMDVKAYKEQKRGGKGMIGSNLATGDFVRQLITCSTYDYLMFFTSKGKVLWLKAYDIPEAERYSKGKALANLLNLNDENITSVISVSKFEDDLFMVTKQGIVKKISLDNFSKPRASGVRAINLPADSSDSLIDVQIVQSQKAEALANSSKLGQVKGQEVLLATRKGQAIRFDSNDVREMGRASYGVTGIKLDKGDEVISLEILRTQEVLTITKNGFGKRTLVKDYRKTARAGKGVRNLKVTEKTGDVVTTVSVNPSDSIIITTAKGLVLRTSLKNIRVMGRATQGVRIVKLSPGDSVTDLVKVQEAGNGGAVE